MRRLPLKLRKNGFDYIQWICSGNYYIYEQDYNSGITYGKDDTPKEQKFYEVFKAKVRPAETFNGKVYPKREVFPSDENFGNTAWAYRTFEEALDKLMRLKGHKP